MEPAHRGMGKGVWRRFDISMLLSSYAVLLFALFGASLAIYVHHQPSAFGVGSLAAMALMPLLEIIVFLCMGRVILLIPGERGAALLRTLLLALNAGVFSAAYLVQCYALVLSNAFVSVLAVENMNEARFTTGMGPYLLFGAGAIAYLGFVALAWLLRGQPRQRRAAWKPVLLLVGLLGVVVVSNVRTSVAGGSSGLQRGQSPLAALAHVGVSLQRRDVSPTPSGALRDIQRCGIRVGSGRYPFMKSFVNGSALPFPTTRAQAKPNVIVLFLEGTSARMLEAYGGKYAALTPNMARMARDSMLVTNYFNHTAATHRGLQGQMTSGFPLYGGVENGAGWEEGDNASAYARHSYSTLSRTLHGVGYHTVFFSPHQRSDALTSLIGMLGFDEVYTFEKSRRELLDHPDPSNRGSLTDRDQFRAVTAFIERYPEDKPFFIGVYNIGTHAFLDVDPQGQRYRDGENMSLNTLHNLDRQFGAFYEKFMRSRHAANTLLILTSDHAHYPEPPYVAVAGSDAPLYFVDRIPLLVRAPWLQLPASYDAHDRTSLDLTPTILQLLGIEHVDNSFVGRSIFDRGSDRDLQLAPIGRSIYAIYRGQVYPPTAIPKDVRDQYDACQSVVDEYYSSEIHDTVFMPAGSAATVGSRMQ
jgi:arylsulfatase A-like enzyme